MKKLKVAFIDRDGTIIWEPDKPNSFDPEETFPLKSIDQLKLINGAISGLLELKARGFKLIMVTNQSSLGKPQHPKETFNLIMDELIAQLNRHNIDFEHIFICPHAVNLGCDCRKPNAKGVLDYLDTKDYEVDFHHSLMFGDRESDRVFAENLGVNFIKIERNVNFYTPFSDNTL